MTHYAPNMSANLEDPAVATVLVKVNLTPIPKKGSTKQCSNHKTMHSSPMLVSSCLKFFILGLSTM